MGRGELVILNANPLDTLLREIPFIPNEMNYWLVRANGGKYYDDFLFENYIAVDTNGIPLEDLKDSKSLVDLTIQNYKDTFFKEMSGEPTNKITNFAKRTFKFTHEMKNNDIVIVPSKQSKRFIIGIVGDIFNSTKIETNDFNDGNKRERCSYNLRREVQWFKEIKLKELDAKLLWIKSAHQTILNLKKDEPFIDPLISPFYFKDKKFFSHYAVTTKEDISVDTWTKFQNSLTSNLGNASSRTVLKQNVQSEGFIALIVAWEWVTTNINVIVPVLSGGIALLGVSKSKIKVGDQEYIGPLPIVFHRKETKAAIKADIELKTVDIESKKLDNELKRMQIDELKKGSSVSVEVPEMKLKIRNSGNVLPFQKKQSLNDQSDEGKS
jgi:hypothetical protein